MDRFRLHTRKKFFTLRVIRHLKSYWEKLWLLLPGGIQGQARWGSEQPSLLEGIPAHGKGLGTRWSLRSFQTKPFNDFMTNYIQNGVSLPLGGFHKWECGENHNRPRVYLTFKIIQQYIKIFSDLAWKNASTKLKFRKNSHRLLKATEMAFS